MMTRTLTAFALCFLCKTMICSHNQCKSYFVANSLLGWYCPTTGKGNTNVPWHQCKLFCLQTPTCQAVNYNFATNSCTNIKTTCPQAKQHPNMTFALFTGIQPAQCMEWIPMTPGHFPGDRAMARNSERFLARMQKDGNDFLGYLLTRNYECYANDENGTSFQTSIGAHPCQFLRIRDGCTVLYMNYNLGTPLPPNALIWGYTAGGLPGYFVRPNECYIPVFNSLVRCDNATNRKVQLLVSI